jgi:Skp family chaperone for outer membrane proteins
LQNQKLKEGWRLSAKLDRIGADLEKARKKRAEWDAKVKDLERRYREEENSEIHEMVHAANLNPEQLSELLRMFAADMAPKPDTINTMNEEETQNEI